MSRKAKRKRRQRRKPTAPPPPTSRPEPVPSTLRTPIGDLVRYEGRTPYIEYFLFRPEHEQVRLQLIERARAEEEIDWTEEAKRLTRIGLLMLALDDYGFDAYLFLDRALVEESELETLIQGTYDLLKQIPPRPEGGSLVIQWMEEIAEYSLGSAERKGDAD
jgi:hypothetical protein